MKESILIGIGGGSGSGKTTFLKHLRRVFTEDELCIVSQDDYYKPREEQKTDNLGIKNFDLPTSILSDELIRDLNSLLLGNIVRRQEYTFNNEKATASMITFKPAPIIVVEGLFVFHVEELWDMQDYRIFISAKENLKVIRRIKRDQIERNYPLEDVLYRYENHVMKAYERYIAPFKDKVDVVINNNKKFDRGFRVVVGFLKNQLVESAAINKSKEEFPSN